MWESMEIDRMSPGEDLNILVAREVMGAQVIRDDIYGLLEMGVSEKGETVYVPLRAYSEDLPAAKRVITKMIEMNYEDETAYWEDEDRAEIICKAALRAVLRRKKAVADREKRSWLKVVK
jgi:hypothetical protein